MGREAQGLAALYLQRARCEFDDLQAAGFLLAGSAFAPVLLVKGELDDAERDGGPLLGGADGAALQAALDRLGYPDDGWGACSAVVREGGAWRACASCDLAWAVEVFDPELVVALDDKAAEGLAACWDLAVSLRPGKVVRVRGRRVLALGGFAAALGDPRKKQLMWARLKQVPPLGAPL